MTATESQYLMMLYVQQRLYEGLQPDEDGWYKIKRKEFLDDLGMTPSTFNYQISNFVEGYMRGWNLEIMFKLKGLIHENLYTEVSYEKGVLRFKRNTYSMRPELSYIWARKPLGWENRRFYYENVPVPDNVILPITD